MKIRGTYQIMNHILNIVKSLFERLEQAIPIPAINADRVLP